MENLPLSRAKNLDSFILNLESGKWISTFKFKDKQKTDEVDTELINIVKQWIDGDFLGSEYSLEFNSIYSKFRKIKKRLD
jgi:hypothetical protein